MAVSAVSSTLATTATTPPRTTTTNAAQETQDQFLRLLVTQLQNQNPLDPVENTEFIAQLAQFQSLESLQQLNTNFGQLLLLQGLNQGAELIGKTISFQRSGSQEVERGVVESVSVDRGQVQLLVGGKTVALAEVRGVEAAPVPSA